MDDCECEIPGSCKKISGEGLVQKLKKEIGKGFIKMKKKQLKNKADLMKILLGGVGHALYKKTTKNMKEIRHTDVKGHKHDKPVHVSEIMSELPRKRMLTLIKKHHDVQGSGIFKKLKKLGKKAKKEVVDFWDGKKSLKPSKLLEYTSKAMGVASLIPSPLSTALKVGAVGATMGSKVLKKRGRGADSILLEGQGLLLPGQEGEGLLLPGAGLRLAGEGKRRKIGSREDVFHGRCERTGGGLRKKDLRINPKTKKIVSIKRSELAKKRYRDGLFKPRSRL